MNRILKTFICIFGLLLVGNLIIPNYSLSQSYERKTICNSNQNAIKTGDDPTVFISVWNTNSVNWDSSGYKQVHLPLIEEGIYDFTINWGDGCNNTITVWNQTENLHTYSTDGNYTILINGIIIGWRFTNEGDMLKLCEIKQWGCLLLGNTGSYFSGCANLNLIATDQLNLTGTTNLSQMFKDCTNLGIGGNLNNWDVSRVTNMSGMFYGAIKFNQPLDTWDVSHVIDMSSMFYNAFEFNQPIGMWNVSQVTDMRYMFSRAFTFNQPLGDWDVSHVIDMRYMFEFASVFNHPLDTWNVSSVINMESMFASASSFNYPLEHWDVSHVIDMILMFEFASNFNQPLEIWDVSCVTIMNAIFADAASFNQPLEIWNVSHVTEMCGMFAGALSFNQPLEVWNVSHVTDMRYMFHRAITFNQSLEDWDVSHVINMQGMFMGANSFNQPLEDWDVSHVIDMGLMFDGAHNFNQPLGRWNVSCVKSMNGMFIGANSFNQPLGDWDVSHVTDMISMFVGVTLSTDNYDHLLLGWSQLSLQNGVEFDAGYSKYSSYAATARRKMIYNYNWDIHDGGRKIGIFGYFGILSGMLISLTLIFALLKKKKP